MKKLTYEDWLENPTPRKMWVWDRDESVKKQYKVVYFSQKQNAFPILAVTDDEKTNMSFKHCAEIVVHARRMSNRELSHWLREKPTRESKCANDNYIYSVHAYKENCGDEEVNKNIVIREDDGEWREPIVETEE